MDATDCPAKRLVGDWRCQLTNGTAEVHFFRVTADFKFFDPCPWVYHSKGKENIRYSHFRMLAENITVSSFVLRFAGKTGGSQRRYFFEGEILVLVADGMDGELRWNCYRITQDELPEHFEPEFAKAMEKPWV